MSALLKREDFGLGPISYDEIEPGLFLGGLSAATDIETLTKLKITHILTIDVCPLPRNILDLNYITSKFIQLSDQPKEDLLSFFDDTFEFINDGLLKNGKILVHCYFGVSRSASVVIAYIMRKYKLNRLNAYEKVKAKRSIARPNNGFMEQLNIYFSMNWKVERENMQYKIFRLSIAADKVKRVKILPQNFLDLIKPDPGLQQSHPDTKVYRCKKCRRALASERNLLTHSHCGSKNALCREIYFVEPLNWMNVVKTIEGKLHCPNCKYKIGSFSWIMGCKCPCGQEVAPAFYLVPSKVDYTDVVKNVEMTF